AVHVDGVGRLHCAAEWTRLHDEAGEDRCGDERVRGESACAREEPEGRIVLHAASAPVNKVIPSSVTRTAGRSVDDATDDPDRNRIFAAISASIASSATTVTRR